MDRNNDGVITREEWRGDSDRSFDNNDWNGDGVLSGDEVRPGARRPGKADPFTAADRNNDGVVAPNEWTGTMQDFNRLDLDGNGVLSAAEFRRQSANTQADRFSELDYNNDGFLSRGEWNNSARVFDQLDRNRDGRLSRDEFYNRSQTPAAVFSELDTNNDGRISRSEWRTDAASFNRLDTNKDNFLSQNEFSGNQSTSLVEQIFQEIFKK